VGSDPSKGVNLIKVGFKDLQYMQIV
jgi:hypothetical protein